MFSPWDYVPNFPFPIETPRPVPAPMPVAQDKSTGSAESEACANAPSVTERRDTPEIYIPYI